MKDELYRRHREKACINVGQAPANEPKEGRRSALRTAQKRRRKAKLKQVWANIPSFEM